MGHMKFHPLTAGCLDSESRLAKCLHQVLNFVRRQRTGNFLHDGAGDGRGCHRLFTGNSGQGLPSGMIQLHDNFAALPMDGLGQAGKSLDIAIIMEAHHSFMGFA